MADAIALHDDPAIQQRRWLILGGMCLALVLVVMSVSALNVALPTLQQDLGAGATSLQWIVDAYAIVFAALLLTAGALGDRYGRKGALLAGLAVFAGGAVIGGIATSASQVIAARAVMGIGAAFVMPATLSLIVAVFPPRERTRAIAIWAGFAGAGGALGPIVSGALLEHFWWGSTLLVNLPVVAVVAVAVALLSPKSRDDRATPLDPLGAALSLVGIGSLLFGIIEGPERGWTDTLVVLGFVLAAAVLAVFIRWEQRAEHPMLPLEFFRDRRFSVGSGVVTMVFFAMFGFWFLNSLYLQFARGYSALEAGLSTLPMAFAMVAVAPRSAALAERFGPGRIIATGFALVATGFAVLALVGSATPYVVLALAYVLLGAGMGMTAAPATGLIMGSIPLAKAGVGSAVNDTTRELGGALGIAALGSIANATYRSGVDLDGSGLPPEAVRAAEESIGAAVGIASQLPEGGALLIQRASAAFTDAFNLTSATSAAIAVAMAVAVAFAFGRAGYRTTPEPAADRVAKVASP